MDGTSFASSSSEMEKSSLPGSGCRRCESCIWSNHSWTSIMDHFSGTNYENTELEKQLKSECIFCWRTYFVEVVVLHPIFGVRVKWAVTVILADSRWIVFFWSGWFWQHQSNRRSDDHLDRRGDAPKPILRRSGCSWSQSQRKVVLVDETSDRKNIICSENRRRGKLLPTLRSWWEFDSNDSWMRLDAYIRGRSN